MFARAARRVRATPRELAVILAAASVVALAWMYVLPPMAGPDEPGHLAYTQQLAETGDGPRFVGGTGSMSHEIGVTSDQLTLRPIGGVPFARPAQTELEKQNYLAVQEQVTDEQRADGTGPSPLARNPQLYYLYEAVPYLAFERSNLLDRIVAMRLWNALLFVITVWLTWQLSVELFGAAARLRHVLATSIVVLWPMLGFMAGAINPDTGLVTAYALLAWIATRLVRRGPTLGLVIGVWASAALCLLVHGRGLPGAAVAIAALAAAFVRHRPPLRRYLGWTAAGAAAAGLPVLVSQLALPHAGTGSLYGGQVNLGRSFSVRQFLGQVWQFYFDKLSFMQPRLGPDYGYRQMYVERFFAGVFGGLDVTYPIWVYDVVQVFVMVGIIALWTSAAVNWRGLVRSWTLVLPLLTLAVGLLVFLHAASYRALVSGPGDPLITGRYLLPLVPVIAVAVAAFVGRLPRWSRGYVAGGLLALMFVLHLGGLGATILRYHG